MAGDKANAGEIQRRCALRPTPAPRESAASSRKTSSATLKPQAANRGPAIGRTRSQAQRNFTTSRTGEARQPIRTQPSAPSVATLTPAHPPSPHIPPHLPPYAQPLSARAHITSTPTPPAHATNYITPHPTTPNPPPPPPHPHNSSHPPNPTPPTTKPAASLSDAPTGSARKTRFPPVAVSCPAAQNAPPTKLGDARTHDLLLWNPGARRARDDR